MRTEPPYQTLRQHAPHGRGNQIGRHSKIAKPGDKYILGKPSEHQKIDITMADVLAHEAAADMRADGWSDEPESDQMVFFR